MSLIKLKIPVVCLKEDTLFFQLNPDVNAFQRKFVNEIMRCEEMERKLSKLFIHFFATYSCTCNICFIF